ncbi:MAG TPA: hypothetical protein VGQ76_14475 [Thermoanaerobaculia bacterium]|jgi:hypothetical protein|nr:hypothetical protein [Thermoanaerobaculia bacterium]
MVALSPSPADLDVLAQERLDDAYALLHAGRYAGAHYVCGYAVEMKLKAQICRTHGWVEYPPEVGARLAQALKTHNLDQLLLFTAVGPTISTVHRAPWSIVLEWNPEQRYELTSLRAEERARAMIDATKVLLAVL